MKHHFFPVLAGFATLLHGPSLPAQSADPAQLSAEVQKLFAAKCGNCHKDGAEQAEAPYFVGNLSSLNSPELVKKDKAEDSKLYSLLVNGKMPRTNREERAAGKKAVPLTPDETQLVLAWIKAGSPDPNAAPVVAGTNPATPVTTTVATPAQAAAQQPAVTETPKPQNPAPPADPLPASRKIVTEADILAGAVKDLLSLPEEERGDVRYLSIHPQHNNVNELNEVDAWLTRCGVRKLLNSLSTNPKIVEFEKTGPFQVLHRVHLREIGWTAELWDKVTVTYPYALDGGSLAALAGPAHCAVPLVRADWFAANVTRPPLYDLIMKLPNSAVDLEKRLGIDIAHNLREGDALRSGFTQSGISKQNRLVERHEIKAYPGYYWKSYDFKHNDGRGRLADFPLGPQSAHLFANQFSFTHDGGEIIYSLPNGLQAYMLINQKDEKIDIGPVEVVSDKLNITGDSQVVNAFSCMACHSQGMKELPLDELRNVAGSPRFSADAQRLIERLFPVQDKINESIKADTLAFQKAVAAADVDVKAKKEPILALVDYFENDVTLSQAAAEMGMDKAAFEKALDTNNALADTRTALRGPGIPRVAFAEHFLQLATRLGLGKPRVFANAPAVFVQATDHAGVKADLAASHLAVELKPNQTTYKKGDQMLFTVLTSEDAFVRLLYQDAEGKVKILLPNAAHDGKIKGGVPVTFGDEHAINPVTGKAFRIRCTPPFGREMIAAVVSNTPFKDNEDIRKEAAAKGGIADGKRTSKGAEVEIVEAARARTQDARLGVARVFLTTEEK